MAPLPLEGIQTPVANTMIQGGMGGPQEGNRGGMISLAMLIDFIVQRTYHELTVLAELLPRKTDMERKIEIYNFALRTRQLFVRLLALVKWANSASKVEKSARIMAFLDKQSLLFVDTADMLARMARETLVQARLPNFHIPAAVEVLTTGTYSKLPSCIREKIVPPDPITTIEKRQTLLRLNQVIQHRLVTGNLLPQMKNLKIENGRVTFHVENEFEVSLTVMGEGPNIPWRLLDIDILVEDKETGDGKALVHALQAQYIHQLIQSRLVDNPIPLTEVYNTLHFFCLSLQLEVLYSQTLRLIRDRLDRHIHVDEYIPGKSITISYWCELTSKNKDSTSKDARSELGYRLTIQLDSVDLTRPLSVIHVPSLGNKEIEIADRAIRSEFLSMERLLVHSIYVRSKNRLHELKAELHGLFKDIETTVQGSPAILSVAVLQPCLRAEQLLITVDTHSGMIHCHVPQYEIPLMSELENVLNGERSRLPGLLSELRYWITQRRCEKSLQHLPATAHDKLPLLCNLDHPMNKLSRHRMYIKLHRHANVVLLAEFKEKEVNHCEIECRYYIVVVKNSSIEDNPNDESIETDTPKVYLKVQSLFELDSFVATHGVHTSVDEFDLFEPGKRKLPSLSGRENSRKAKQPAYFLPELAYIVAMCDERLPFVVLGNELERRNILHQGLQVEANASSLILKLIQLPPPTPEIGRTSAWFSLLKRILSISFRVQTKGIVRSWLCEFIFFSTPIPSMHPKEQGSRRLVFFHYDMGTADQISTVVNKLLNDWAQIVHIYTLAHNLSEYIEVEKYNIASMYNVKSFTYNKLVISYGPEKGALMSITWHSPSQQYKLIFAATSALNAHSLIRTQLESHLNVSKNIAQLIQLLYETYEPLISISKLSSLPQLGVQHSRPSVPMQTFIIIPQSCYLIRVAYQGMYCMELRIHGGGLVSLRDGAYSRFDRSNVVDEFTPTQGLKTFLSKYVDESAVIRRRSQSEDDNPPSPISMEVDGGGFLGHHRGPQSPAGGREPGLRFNHPLTPPPGSNPHTPASPHMGGQSAHANFGSSPATSFSPTSLQTNVNPSPHMPHPSPGGIVANSPLNPHVPSPGGLLSNPSPGPVTNLPGHSPGSSFMGGHTDGSPFPSSQSMASPAVSNWPGSPSMPRPSPARPGQSPGGPIMHSPQADHKIGAHVPRVLPQRSWAGAVPTVITHEALETLCCPVSHPQGFNGPELPPLERFLGCIYMRRHLQRYVASEAFLTAINTNEPGTIHFKVGESLHCRVFLNPNHLQCLHMKITPIGDHKDIWSMDELTILEKFFDTRASAPPYKPNAMFAFCSMLNVPVNVLKDFMQILRLDLMPGLGAGMKWGVSWTLRIPPSATPIVPIGMASILVYKTKILFFLQITRNYQEKNEPISMVLPLVYDISTNITQLAEKRDTGPTPAMNAVSNMLKQFAQYQNCHNECSLYPAVRDLLTNLTLPSEGQQSNTAPMSQIQSPAMQMVQGPGGYSVNMPMGMSMGMGPQ